MIKKIILILCVIIETAMAFGTNSSLEFYVSTKGNDANPGTKDQPRARTNGLFHLRKKTDGNSRASGGGENQNTTVLLEPAEIKKHLLPNPEYKEIVGTGYAPWTMNIVACPPYDISRGMLSLETSGDTELARSMIMHNIYVGILPNQAFVYPKILLTQKPEQIYKVRMNHNLFYSLADTSSANEYLERARSYGQELNSVNTDPLFEDVIKGDFRLRTDSPLKELGFNPMEWNPDDWPSLSLDFDQYPGTEISNKMVKMKVYLPDPENGIYRATRFDWSGVIGSVQYKGHEYFGYWRETHDPYSPADVLGPAESSKSAGLGYDEAKPGGSFIRLGVGFVGKGDELKYNHDLKTYKVLDNGKWAIDKGDDWITFTHIINSDFGYGYIYKKTVRLKKDGFEIEHKLRNTGTKIIETDQYNHNFFMIDNEPSGPSLKIIFPYAVSTDNDLKGLMEIKDNTLSFTKELEKSSIFMELKGYSGKVKDNKFTV